jgi:hypothetical protein
LTSRSASTHDAGSSNVRPRRIFSAAWRTRRRWTSTGSGAVGSTARATSTSASNPCGSSRSTAAIREIEKPWQRARDEEREADITAARNADVETLLDRRPELEDFYDEYDEYAVTPWDYAEYAKLKDSLTEQELALLADDALFYAVTFVNHGGLVTPLPLRIEYADGATEDMLIPAEIWRRDTDRVTRLLIREREITAISFDPQRRTADANEFDNHWPRKLHKSRFQLFKEKEQPNPMRRLDEADWKQPIR